MNENFIPPDMPVFTTSAAAGYLKVRQRTLIIYEDEKILCPARTDANRRLYSANDIKKGQFIQLLVKDMRLNLAGVKITLGLLEMLELSPDDYEKTIAKFYDL